jgi:peptidoglycan/LPS O-acetylase OafA/YrhL
MSLPAHLDSKLSHSHIPALDGLRAVAVFLVIVAHFGFVMVPGTHSVMIFFVLSGFLITWLLLKENERYGAVSLAAFYKRRTLRIFPAFYAYWMLMITFLVGTGRAVLWPHAWSALFYTSNYISATDPVLDTNGPCGVSGYHSTCGSYLSHDHSGDDLSLCD